MTYPLLYDVMWFCVPPQLADHKGYDLFRQVRLHR